MIFKCRNCGGNTVYNPEKGELYCPQCESLNSGEKVSSSTITECSNCGAPITPGDFASALRCPSCGSYIILEERVEGENEPELILPFKLGKDKAVEILNKEFKKRLFTPDGFLSYASIEAMEGAYVPFYMYDYHSDINYSGKGTKVRKWTSGSTEYTETSYYDVIREMDVEFDKIPVDASKRMENSIMDLMEPYEYQALCNFEEKYMSGFEGEMNSDNADDLEERAKNKAEKDSNMLLRDSLSGYTTMRAVSENISIARTGLHYALLPVWVYIFQYQGVNYKFHVNGQTGKVIGKTPLSSKKIGLYSLTTFMVTLLILTFIKVILGGL